MLQLKKKKFYDVSIFKFSLLAYAKFFNFFLEIRVLFISISRNPFWLNVFQLKKIESIRHLNSIFFILLNNFNLNKKQSIIKIKKNKKLFRNNFG